MPTSKEKKLIFINNVDSLSTDNLRKKVNAYFDRENNLEYSSNNTSSYSFEFGKIKLFETSSFPFFIAKQQVTLNYSGEEYDSFSDWKSAIYTSGSDDSLINLDKKFINHNINIDTPLSERETKQLNSSKGARVYNYDFFYNFFIENYESNIENETIPESVLPDAFILQKYIENDSVDKLRRQITLLGNLNESEVENIFSKNRKKYFSLFGSRVRRLKKEILKKISAKNSKFNLKLNDIEQMEGAVENKIFYPMYFLLDFPAAISGPVLNSMTENNLDDDLIRYINNTSFTELDFFSKNEEVEGYLENKYRINTNIREEKIRGVPIDNFFQGEVSNVVELIKKVLFTNNFKSVIRQNLLNYEDILDGDSNYTEILFYEVRKINSFNGNILKNYIFSNVLEKNIINFIDTQVKYNKQYTYRVYAYAFTIGQEYEYSDLLTSNRSISISTKPVPSGPPLKSININKDLINTTGIFKNNTNTNLKLLDRPSKKVFKSKFKSSLEKITINTSPNKRYTASFVANVNPSVFILEIPLIEINGRILDNPPLPPDVNIVPYKNNRRNILLNINSTSGDTGMDSIVFSEREQSVINRLRDVKQLLPSEKLNYRSDDPPQFFEIYRTTQPPKTIFDFQNSLLTVLDTRSGELNRFKSSAAYLDTLQTNQKYYYMFRAIDVHLNPSNPSDIYEVELEEDSGVIIPSVKNYIIKDDREIINKSFNRFLHIVPSYTQALIDEDASRFDQFKSAKELQGKIKLGVEKETLWGKKFKIRLISKDTGRKIDFNIDFKTKHIKMSEESD